MALINSPSVKLAIVGVSRDCFPIELTRTRLQALGKACQQRGQEVLLCKTIIENEVDALAALDEAHAAGANAAVIFSRQFRPRRTAGHICPTLQRPGNGLCRR